MLYKSGTVSTPKCITFDTQTALLRYLKRPFRSLKRPFRNANLYNLNLLKLPKCTEKKAKNVGLKSSYTALNALWLNVLYSKM